MPCGRCRVLRTAPNYYRRRIAFSHFAPCVRVWHFPPSHLSSADGRGYLCAALGGRFSSSTPLTPHALLCCHYCPTRRTPCAPERARAAGLVCSELWRGLLQPICLHLFFLPSPAIVLSLAFLLHPFATAAAPRLLATPGKSNAADEADGTVGVAAWRHAD